MTIEETKKILQRISNVYSYAFANKTKEEKYQILNEWQKAFESTDYLVVANRLEKHIANSKYTPTIAELKNTQNGFHNFNENKSCFDEIENIKRYMKKYEKYMHMSLEELKTL